MILSDRSRTTYSIPANLDALNDRIRGPDVLPPGLTMPVLSHRLDGWQEGYPNRQRWHGELTPVVRNWPHQISSEAWRVVGNVIESQSVKPNNCMNIMRTKYVLLSAATALSLMPGLSLAQTRTETFPSALGDMFSPVGNPNANGAGGNLDNFGFSASTHAGGALGEAGGEFNRRGFPLDAYADINLGGSLGRNENLVMSGKFNVDGNFGFDGFAFLGYFDAVTSATASPFLGIRLQEVQPRCSKLPGTGASLGSATPASVG